MENDSIELQALRQALLHAKDQIKEQAESIRLLERALISFQLGKENQQKCSQPPSDQL